MKRECSECNEKISVGNFSESQYIKCERCGNLLKFDQRELSIFKSGSLYGFCITALGFAGMLFYPILKTYIPVANIATSYMIAIIVFMPLILVSIRWRNKLLLLHKSSSQEESFIKKDLLIKLIGIVFLVFLIIVGVFYPFF